jgi:hypothetical protein
MSINIGCIKIKRLIKILIFLELLEIFFMPGHYVRGFTVRIILFTLVLFCDTFSRVYAFDAPKNVFNALRKCGKRTKKKSLIQTDKKVRQNPKKAKKQALTHSNLYLTHLLFHAKLTHQKINAPK